MEVFISIHKAVKKEMIEINNPKMEIVKIPKAWRNADGTKLVEPVVAPVVQPVT